MQRKSRLVILGNLGMPGHTHLNDSINLKKSLMFICKQKINFILPVFLDILQRYYKLVILGTFGEAWLHKPKMIVSSCRKLSCLSAGRRTTSSPMFFGGYCKDMQSSYFAYFRHVWIHTPKMVKSTCRKFWCFSTWQK